MSQKKERDQTIARELSETDISSMPDRKFKVMIIKVLIDLEKRVEDIGETFNKDIKMNQL